MYYYLLSALKRRIILELQESFARHPVYSKIVPFIQNKYAFDERPQFGIVVKGSNANRVQLSADNFMGIVSSHVMLAYLEEPSHMLEWAKEDIATLKANQDRMPIAPGIYYLECLTAPVNPGEQGTFVIDPLLTVTDDPLLLAVSGVESEARFNRLPVQGTLTIWENRQMKLREGVDFTVNYQTGAVKFKTRFNPKTQLTADFRYVAPSIGPVPFAWNTADFTTLRGVILAFGKRAKAGDKVAVVVYEDRVDCAEAFGGRFDASFDINAIAQDPMQMEEIADFALMSLWADKRAALSTEGIEIVEVSIGGEAEETYDETGDIWFYTASLSINLQADWEVHVPLPLTIHRATTASTSGEASVDSDRQTSATSRLVALPNSGLFFATAPVIRGRNASYERIT